MIETSALWASIVIGGVAQIALKLAVSGWTGTVGSSPIDWCRVLAHSGWFWLYAISFALATVLWLLALSKLNISYAFPLLSSSYIFVALLASSFFGERVSGRRWFAIAVISCGVVVIART